MTAGFFALHGLTAPAFARGVSRIPGTAGYYLCKTRGEPYGTREFTLPASDGTAGGLDPDILDNLSQTILQICDQAALPPEFVTQLLSLVSKRCPTAEAQKALLALMESERLGAWLDMAAAGPEPNARPLSIYRQPLAITEIRVYRGGTGITAFPVCPRCGVTLEREYQRFCDRCGQLLEWRSYGRAAIVLGRWPEPGPPPP